MNKVELIRGMREQLANVMAQRQMAKHQASTLAARMALKRYQSARLAKTHADLLANNNTHAAAEFFLEELYGARDLTQRDADIERIIPTLERLLSYHTLDTIANAITLDALSENMDAVMADQLGENFTEAEYIDAFRELTTSVDRERQIGMVQALGTSLCSLVRIPFLATTLVVMRGPARMAKLGHLQAFLEQGFTTFKAMKQPQAFVQTIVERELQISRNIYAGQPNPFQW